MQCISNKCRDINFCSKTRTNPKPARCDKSHTNRSTANNCYFPLLGCGRHVATFQGKVINWKFGGSHRKGSLFKRHEQSFGSGKQLATLRESVTSFAHLWMKLDDKYSGVDTQVANNSIWVIL